MLLGIDDRWLRKDETRTDFGPPKEDCSTRARKRAVYMISTVWLSSYLLPSFIFPFFPSFHFICLFVLLTNCTQTPHGLKWLLHNDSWKIIINDYCYTNHHIIKKFCTRGQRIFGRKIRIGISEKSSWCELWEKFYLQVIKAYDHKHQQYVALKLVRNEKRFHRQAEEEIRILVGFLKRNPNSCRFFKMQLKGMYNRLFFILWDRFVRLL